MGKVVLITGASRGIGAATAQLFAQNGWNVLVNYNKSEQDANRLVAEINGRAPLCACIKADVSDERQVKAMFEEARGLYGGVDVLVNNAGIAHQALFLDTQPKDWDAVFDTGIKGMYHCCRCALPGMVSAQRGAIVNVSSVWGLSGASCEVAYSAAKAAVIGFTKALAKEMGPSGIRVNCVAPGVIQTDMLAGLSGAALAELADQTPLMRLGQADDVARAIYFLASSGAGFITGQVLGVDGGFGV